MSLEIIKLIEKKAKEHAARSREILGFADKAAWQIRDAYENRAISDAFYELLSDIERIE